MIKELRTMRKQGGETRSLANYIATLQAKGVLTQMLNDKGYVCYDTEEYKAYKKQVKRGRPPKYTKKGE